MEEIRPVSRSKAAAQRAYDRMSAFYEVLTAGEASMRRRLLQLGAAKAGERVLDLGTGTGPALEALGGSVGSEGMVLGLDLSRGMLRRARDKADRGLLRCRLVQADAARLPLRRATFDRILMSFSLELFDTQEIPRVLQECRRCLRAGGRIVIGCLAVRPKRSLPVRFYEWLHDRLPETLDCRPIPVGRFLAQAGFAVERFEDESLWGLPVDLMVARPALEG